MFECIDSVVLYIIIRLYYNVTQVSRFIVGPMTIKTHQNVYFSKLKVSKLEYNVSLLF